MIDKELLRDTYRFKGLRRQLSETIRKKGIKDEAVIHAIGKVPRHYFLDSAFVEQAYTDKALQIGEGQTISQPYTVAFQTTLLEIKPGDKTLEIGLGSGYQACILKELGADVYSIERIKKLYLIAEELLNFMGYNINIFLGDGSLGLPKFAPFDKILVTAAASVVPQKLVDQLQIGGLLVVPIGDRGTQTMVRIIKTSATKYIREDHGDFRFVPMIGDGGWRY